MTLDRIIVIRVTVLLTAAFLAQTFHWIEHAAQVYQRLWLGMGPQSAHGILFFLDVEWNHFFFNLIYFLLLAPVVYFFLFHPAFVFLRERRLELGIFGLGFLSQGYHLFEHTIRMGQFFQTNCTPCPGILGWYVDPTYLHFTLTTIPWILPLAVAPALLAILRRS